jgi:uncharacterized membrane protein YagU involved in acid resistance
MTVNRVEYPAESQLFKHGLIGGIVAGIVFAISEMLINVILGEPFLGPLRLISSIALGTEALQPTYSIVTAGLVGLIVHMILSMIYGLIFVFILKWIGQLHVSTGLLLLYGSLFGLVLWLVNFMVIVPAAFPQFTQVNQLWNGFVAHTFFFGAVLGAYVANTLSQAHPVETHRERHA